MTFRLPDNGLPVGMMLVGKHFDEPAIYGPPTGLSSPASGGKFNMDVQDEQDSSRDGGVRVKSPPAMLLPASSAILL